MTPADDVIGQHTGTRRHNLVGHRHRALGQCLDGGSGFAAWGSTQVQIAHRLMDEATYHVRNEHRRGVLHVVASCMPVGVEGEGRAVVQVITLTAPGHAACPVGHISTPRGVDAHGDAGLARRDGIGQRLPLVGQQPPQLLYKRLR